MVTTVLLISPSSADMPTCFESWCLLSATSAKLFLQNSLFSLHWLMTTLSLLMHRSALFRLSYTAQIES